MFKTHLIQAKYLRTQTYFKTIVWIIIMPQFKVDQAARLTTTPTSIGIDKTVLEGKIIFVSIARHSCIYVGIVVANFYFFYKKSLLSIWVSNYLLSILIHSSF